MNRRLLALLTALSVFGLDRWTKWLVESRFDTWDTKHLIPGYLDIVRSENPGIAFGIFQDSVSEYRTLALVITSVIAIAVLCWLLWRIDSHDRYTASGITLIFGGALGNVFDRIRFGHVTDFIDFHLGTAHWYVFNLADTAICIGAGFLILGMFLAEKTTQHVSTALSDR
jgi:signal peptidase II